MELKENPYTLAPEVEKIAKPLLNDLTKLANICYMFSSKESKWMGKLSKCSAQMKKITDFDYVLTINFNAWLGSTDEFKQALVFHELEHIAWKPTVKDPNIGSWGTAKHDLEEFNSVVARFGKWEDGIKYFVSSIKETPKEEDEKIEELVTGCGCSLSSN